MDNKSINPLSGGSEKRMILNISTEGIYCREVVFPGVGRLNEQKEWREHGYNCRKGLLPLELGKQREHRSPKEEL